MLLILQFTHTYSCGKEEKKSWPQDHTATNIHRYWFCWSIVWERKGDGPSCKYHVSLFHRDIGPKYGVPSKSGTVLDEDIDVISNTCFFLEGWSVWSAQVLPLQTSGRRKTRRRKKARRKQWKNKTHPRPKRWVPYRVGGWNLAWKPVECWSFIQLSYTRITDPRWCRVSAIDLINLPKFHRQSCQNKPFKILVVGEVLQFTRKINKYDILNHGWIKLFL